MRAALLLVLVATGCRSLLDIDDEVQVVDARRPMDAPRDSAPALIGLGEPCSDASTCPAEAPLCAMVGSAGQCTAYCIVGGTFKTDAQGAPQSYMPVPETKDPTCNSIFRGSVGRGACQGFTNVQPPGALQANTNYTFDVACIVQCGAGNSCPGTLSCDLEVQWCY